jgi:hypothetical protein
MPYIKPKDRELIKKYPLSVIDTVGELNYRITLLLNRYTSVPGLSYQRINDVLGALEGAKLEFYRRVAVPYENAKMAENGDVYE